MWEAILAALRPREDDRREALPGPAARQPTAPPRGRRSPPDAMAGTLDRMLRDLEKADALGKAAQLERLVKLQAALIVDLRNQVAELKRR